MLVKRGLNRELDELLEDGGRSMMYARNASRLENN